MLLLWGMPKVSGYAIVQFHQVSTEAVAMFCSGKHSLVKKHRLYVRAYKEAVKQLSLTGLSGLKAEWDLAYALASRARQLAEGADAELQAHIKEHGCGTLIR